MENLLLIYLNWRVLGGKDDTFTVEEELIFHSISEIRQIFNNLYFVLSSIDEGIRKQYYTFINDRDSPYCGQYYETLNKLLK